MAWCRGGLRQCARLSHAHDRQSVSVARAYPTPALAAHWCVCVGGGLGVTAEGDARGGGRDGVSGGGATRGAGVLGGV